MHNQVGGATHSSCVSRLPHVGAAWTQCQPCLAPRLHAACAATDRLFVLVCDFLPPDSCAGVLR